MSGKKAPLRVSGVYLEDETRNGFRTGRTLMVLRLHTPSGQVRDVVMDESQVLDLAARALETLRVFKIRQRTLAERGQAGEVGGNG